MASSSVSFRITRSAEDLAGTLHLLSQRLLHLEQRLAALEAQRVEEQEDDATPALEESLGNAERLLRDCRALLGGALTDPAPLAARHAAASEPGDGQADPAPEAPGDAAAQEHVLRGRQSPDGTVIDAFDAENDAAA